MKTLARVVLTMALLASTAVAVRAAGRGSEDSPNMITMNFQDVDISVLAKFISEITGKNFVMDESVRGKVSIISPTKVTPQQAYTIFQSVLQVKGFTTVPVGPIIKIVPSRMVRESAALTQSQQPGISQGDQYVTRMVKLRNVEAAGLVGVVQPMISRDGLIAAYPETNTLILTDSAWNIQRLLQIIGALDTQGVQQQVVVIPLKLAYADDLAPKIEQIVGASSDASGGRPAGIAFRPGQGVQAPSASAPSRAFKIIPDERTNSLVVLAGPVQMRQIRELVDKLDVHSPNANSRIHVYYLKYAQAGEMMDVLSGLLGGGGGPTQLAPQTGRGALGRVGGMGMSGFGGGSFGGGSFGGSSFGGSSFGGLSNSAFGNSGGTAMGGFGGGMGGFGGGMGLGGGGARSSGGSMGGGGGTASGGGTGGRTVTDFEMPVHVTADPATNSLIISAAPQDYETLRHIIAELDIPRRQIFVQAIIAEVSANRSHEIGVNFQSATGFGNTIGFGQLNFGQLQNALGNPLGMSGLGIGLASGSLCNIPAAAVSTLTGNGGGGGSLSTPSTMSVPCDVALLTALQEDTHSNVLSAPTLLTTDNNEATIVVGENLPFLSGASSSAALSNQIFSSVDRQNVGITLDIVPQITEGGYIKLDVYEEVSAVVPGTSNNTLGPTTTIRSASTTVLVQNHRTTVIGGLMSNESDTALSGVPYLSSIPVLGNLFSDRSLTGEKTNLLVFLTPHVIRDREDLRELSLDEREKFINNLGKKEMHDMPLSQVRELYKPSFSIAVPPGAEIGAPVSAPAGGAGANEPDNSGRPGSFSPTPLNTEEIGPSSKLEGSTSRIASGAAVVPGKALGAAATTPATAPMPASTGATASVDGTSKAVPSKDGGVLDAVSGLFGVRN